MRLFRMIVSAGNDIEAYRAAPPTVVEFSSDEESLAWDASGWEEVE